MVLEGKDSIRVECMQESAPQSAPQGKGRREEEGRRGREEEGRRGRRKGGGKKGGEGGQEGGRRKVEIYIYMYLSGSGCMTTKCKLN